MSWHSGTAFDPPSAGLVSPHQTSPATTTTPIAASPDDASRSRKRKRSSLGGVEHDSADGGGAEGADGNINAGSPTSNANGNKPRHQPGVKRACNDCRQQKVSE